MIERTNAFKVGSQSFLNLVDAQKHDLKSIMPPQTACGWSIDNIAEWVISNKEKILDILTTTAASKTKARKINGGTKRRTAKTVITDANRSSDFLGDNADGRL